MAVDAVLPHLADITQLRAGDVVVGMLPAHLAAQLCASSVRYFHLALDVPAHLRGVELSLLQMEQCAARLQELHIIEILPKGKHESHT